MISEKRKKLAAFKSTLIILWRSSRKYFVLTCSIGIFSSLPSIANLIVWKKVLDLINNFLLGKEVDYSIIFFCIFLHFLLTIVTNFLNKYSYYIQSIYSLLVRRYITNETIDAVMCMELSDIENSDIHNVIEKTNNQACERMMALLGKLVDLVKNVTTFLGMSGVLISFNFMLYIIIFCSVIPVAFYGQKYYSKIFEIYDKRYEKLRYSNELKNIITRSDIFKELKIFNSIPYLKNKINVILDEVIYEEKSVRKKLNIQGNYAEALQLFLTYILKGAIIYIGMKCQYSIGTINMNMESATSVQGAVSNIIMSLIEMYEDCLYIDSFTKLKNIKKTKEIKSVTEKKLISNFDIETIELKDIWFKYNDDSDYIIKGICCKFECNKSYAIVGYNGSGKSTLVKIIMGLYTPQRGSILINNISVNNYDMEEYYKKISAVFQDFAKYPLTIRENIGIGNIAECNNIGMIKMAASSSNSEEFISTLPNQFEEKLVRGWKDSIDLSIGQWQRIAIARSNMRNGTMVIFDEPSASLDAKTENKVLNDMVNKKEGRIAIIITHRFLNIKKVGEILVLNKGALEAKGSHEDLLITNDSYNDLYSSQKELI